MYPSNGSSWTLEATPTFWLNQASRLVVRHFEMRLRPLDFGMAYLPVVMALMQKGELTQKELAERARVEQPTMAALLVRMERDGLILREPHLTDKRSSKILLSAKAKTRLPEVMKQLGKVAERATEGLKKSERARLIGLLQRVVNNLDPDADI